MTLVPHPGYPSGLPVWVSVWPQEHPGTRGLGQRCLARPPAVTGNDPRALAGKSWLTPRGSSPRTPAEGTELGPSPGPGSTGAAVPWQGGSSDGSSGGTSWLPAACNPWGIYWAGSLLPVGVGLDALPEVPASRNRSVMYSRARGLPGMSQQPRSPLQNKLQSTAPEPPRALQGWL